MLFAHLLSRLIEVGSLTLISPAGHATTFGSGTIEGIRPVTIRLHDRRRDWGLGLRPTLAVGEAYMDGALTVERGTLYDFLGVAAYNLHRVAGPPWLAVADRLGYACRWLQQHNPIARAQRNVAHHYDLPAAFYDLFLDPDRQYSCAYFTHAGQSLEEAQAAKKRHVAAKLLLRPGQRVLDIGCGWGGLALGLAAACNVEVVGITLSQEQLDAARRRADRLGLGDRVRFELVDYRKVSGRFDRIVSVGMFEHVGVNHYPEFFRRLGDLLAEDGVALLHSIGRADGPGTTNPWIRKHIFPGGYSPALSEVMPAVERSGFYVTDIEILRGHYAETLRAWRQRFTARRAEAARLFDERFCRMWEFYLAGAETAFRHQGHMVFQMQLAKRQDAVPATRGYLCAEA